MSMHVPTIRPGCWTDKDHSALPIRQDWCFDGGVCCMDHVDEAWSKVAMEHTPGCEGCSRKLRAELVRGGKIVPHPHRIGRRHVPADPVAAGCDQRASPLPA